MTLTERPDEVILLERLRDAAHIFSWPWIPTRIDARSTPGKRGEGYFTEIVTVVLDNNHTRAVFAKTGPRSDSSDMFRGGLPGGLAYEYQCTVEARRISGMGVPRPLGYSEVHGSDMTIFFDEVICRDPALRSTSKLSAAVDWLIDFQCKAAGLARERPFIHRYSEDFYLQWVDPFTNLARIWSDELELPLLRKTAILRRLLSEDAQHLSNDGQETLVHGDFYFPNIIDALNGLVVVDWELSAIASGPLDLAMITLGWSPEICEDVDKKYIQSLASARGLNSKEISRSIDAARRHVIARHLASYPPLRGDYKAIKKFQKRLKRFCECTERKLQD